MTLFNFVFYKKDKFLEEDLIECENKSKTDMSQSLTQEENVKASFLRERGRR